MAGNISEVADGDVLFRDAPCRRRCTSEWTANHSGDALKGQTAAHNHMHFRRDNSEGLQLMENHHLDINIPMTVVHREHLPGRELPRRNCDPCINYTEAEKNMKEEKTGRKKPLCVQPQFPKSCLFFFGRQLSRSPVESHRLLMLLQCSVKEEAPAMQKYLYKGYMRGGSPTSYSCAPKDRDLSQP